MADNLSDHVLITTFDTAEAADQAANDLVAWDNDNDTTKLEAVGVLTRDRNGVKVKNYGARNTGRGAKIGVGLGALAAVLSGGLTLIPSALTGAVAGGAAGTLSHKGLGMSDDDLEALSSELEQGAAALLVLCDESEVDATSAYLIAAGGRPTRYGLHGPELSQAAQSLPEAPKESSLPIFTESDPQP